LGHRSGHGGSFDFEKDKPSPLAEGSEGNRTQTLIDWRDGGWSEACPRNRQHCPELAVFRSRYAVTTLMSEHEPLSRLLDNCSVGVSALFR
jgi:hypothetical protein